MSLKFGWYKTPVPGDREDKKIPHARIISQGTLDTKYMCKMISMSSTISSADVKGVLEALNFWMGFHLAEGNSIELDGLGYFTPTLKSRTVTDENGKTKVIAEADTVSFRCATSLKEQVREAGLEQVKITAAKFQINSGNMKFYRSFLKKQRKLSGMTLEMYFREKLKEQ